MQNVYLILLLRCFAREACLATLALAHIEKLAKSGQQAVGQMQAVCLAFLMNR